MADDPRSKQDKLRALKDEFAQDLPDRMALIHRAADSLHRDPAATLALDGTFRRLVHNLAGAGGTFGFPRLGQEAREFETELVALASGPAPTEADLERVEARLRQLENLAEASVSIPTPTEGQDPIQRELPVSTDRSSLVYIMEDERLLAQEIAHQLRHFGYECELCFSPDALRMAFRKATPDAVVADIGFAEGPLEGPRVLAELQGGISPRVPIIFVSVQSGWEARLAAVRAGGVAYLPKPVEMTSLVAELDRLTGRQLESPYRVLLGDDEPLLARHNAAILQAGGLETEILNDPAELLDHMASFRPDLLLLDLYMPHCSGLEMARVVRQTMTYTHLPIVFLSSEQSRDEQLVAMKEGGDDFIEKPVTGPHLLGAVIARASRFRALRALMNRDGLTGLLNHTNLKLALERELAIALRRSRPLTFVMLDIDLFKTVNDTYGHPVGDRVLKGLSRLLRQRLRRDDVIGRYGGEEFALILPDTGLEQACLVLDQLRSEFATLAHQHLAGTFFSTFSAGLAEARVGCTQEGLIQAADSALYQAKHAGRNQIAQASPAAG